MPTETVKLMKDQLRPALKHLAPDAEWQLSGPVGRARKCDIFKITNNQHTHTLALKVYRDGKTNIHGPKNQFNALQQLACNTGEAVINAPRAHAFLPDANAIVMDWIDAPPLGHALWRSAFSSEDKLAYVQSAAHWLRRFHDNSRIEEKAFDVSALLAKIDTRVENSPSCVTQMKGGDLFLSAYQHLKSAASAAPMIVPHAKLHGDFTPSNVLIRNGEAVGIDIWGVRYGTVYEDIARMLTYLGVSSPYALKRTLFIESGLATPLFNAFTVGYGHDVMHKDMLGLWLTLLYQHMRRWLVFLDWKNQGRSAIKAKLEVERVRRLTSQTLKQLESIG